MSGEMYSSPNLQYLITNSNPFPFTALILIHKHIDYEIDLERFYRVWVG